MIYRKLIKQGNSAFTITLPISWVQENTLQAADIIEIDIENTQLILSTQNKSKNNKIEINVSKLNRPQIFQMILNCYLKGYNEIEITHNDFTTILDIEKELSGMTLEIINDSKITFKSIIKEQENTDLLIKILYHLKALSQKLTILSFDELVQYEKIMDKLILLQIRNYHKYSNLKKEYNNLLLCYIIDTIGDCIIEIKEHSIDSTNLILIEKYISIYIDKVLKNDISNLVLDLREFRNQIKKNTFEDGLTYSLADMMYNFLGFLEK